MKLSIITINRNNAEGLRKTIETVVSQTFTDYEYILIDGASTDGSVDVIKEYADKITYWVSEPDKGIFNAMNKGIKKANGEYLLFLNSGDCLFDGNVIFDFYKFNPRMDIVAGNLEVYIDGIRRIMYSHNGDSFTLDYFYPCDTLPHQATFIKKDCFNKFGLYDETLKIVSDWRFFIKLLVINKGTYEYFNRMISRFDNQGISSQLDNKNILNKEALEYFKSFMTSFVFDSYDKLYKENEEYKKYYNDAIEYKNLRNGDFSFVIKILLWIKSLKKRNHNYVETK